MYQHNAVHIKDVLKEVVKQFGGKKRLKHQESLVTVWRGIAGTKIANQTTIIGIDQKIIRIKVNSAPLLNELANFKKRELLAKINEKMPGRFYQDIKFVH
jgi:hypothetical protein